MSRKINDICNKLDQEESIKKEQVYKYVEDSKDTEMERKLSAVEKKLIQNASVAAVKAYKESENVPLKLIK